MATLTTTPIKVFVSGETVTPTKLNELSQSTVALTAGTIVAADIASDAVTNAKIASGVDASKLTTGTLPADRIGSGSITAAKVADGAVVQTQFESKSAHETLTHSTHWGGASSETSLPASTAGVEVISKAIQPSSATNKVLVTVAIPALTTADGYMRMVVFRGTTAIQADSGYSINADTLTRSGWSMPTTLTVLDSPNTTSSTTYSVRVARDTTASGTFYLNGTSSAQRGGGVYKAQIILQEIKAS